LHFYNVVIRKVSEYRIWARDYINDGSGDRSGKRSPSVLSTTPLLLQNKEFIILEKETTFIGIPYYPLIQSLPDFLKLSPPP